MNPLCDIIAGQSEQNPTTKAELHCMFGGIKQFFAEEALEESESVDAESHALIEERL